MSEEQPTDEQPTNLVAFSGEPIDLTKDTTVNLNVDLTPSEEPAADEKPTIRCFYVPALHGVQATDVVAYACDEEGVTLASHVCSSAEWAQVDIMHECHHESYHARYPNGYGLLWVERPPNNWDYGKELMPESATTDEPQLITPEVEPMAVKLGDQYDECLLGATVRGNFAYSLKRMIDFEVRHRRVTADEAREVIGRDIVEIMRTHGNLSPEFIDDELMVEPVKIIVPN